MGIVGLSDDGVVVLDHEHLSDRAEELLIIGGVVLADVRQDGRFIEEALAVRRLAAGRSLGAVAERVFDLFRQGLERVLGREGAQDGVGVERVAHDGALHALDETADEGFSNRLLDDEPLGAGADLTGVGQSSFDTRLDGLFDVGVVEHHEDVAAAEFKRGFLEHFRRAGGDLRAGALGPCQGHALDTVIADQFMHLVGRDPQIGHAAVRRTGVAANVCEHLGALGHDARVFEQDGVADGDGGSDHADQLVDRKIPRLDGQQDADGMELGPGLAEIALVGLRLQEVGGLFGIVGGDPGTQFDFALALRERLAHFLGHRLGEVILAISEKARQFRQDGQTGADVALRPVGVKQGVRPG